MELIQHDSLTLKIVNHLLLLSLKYWPNPCFELEPGCDYLQKKDQHCAWLGSVFLARLGGSRPSVPPFLYYTLWKTCCTKCPRSTATLGSVTPGPGGDRRRCWCRDNQQKWRQDSTRKLPKKPKTSWLEIWASKNRVLMYLTIKFLPAYLSVTPHVP